MKFYLEAAGYFAATLVGLVITALGVAMILGLSMPWDNEYVVDFGGTIHDPQPIVIFTTCTQRPQGDADLRAYCNMDARHAEIVTPEAWTDYRMGSPR